MANIKTTYPTGSIPAPTIPPSPGFTPWMSQSGEVWTADNTQALWISGAGGTTWRYLSGSYAITDSFQMSGTFTMAGTVNAAFGVATTYIVSPENVLVRWFYDGSTKVAVLVAGPGGSGLDGQVFTTGSTNVNDRLVMEHDNGVWKFYMNDAVVSAGTGTLDGRINTSVGYLSNGASGQGVSGLGWNYASASAGVPVPSSSIRVTAGAGSSIKFG